MAGSEVVAVVDEAGESVVVWWADMGSRAGRTTDRLCGAWTLSQSETSSLASVLACNACLMTNAGRAAIAKTPVALPDELDVPTILSSVTAERDRLQAAFDEAQSKTRSKALVPPRWPAIPEGLDVNRPPLVNCDRHVRVALSLAKWLVDLTEAWSTIEDQRLRRPLLREMGGPQRRPIPLALLPQL